MRTIWKFPLLKREENIIAVPSGAKLLHFGHQGDIGPAGTDEICVWFEVESSSPLQERFFDLRETGTKQLKTNDIYRGTCFKLSLVWHLYEKVI